MVISIFWSTDRITSRVLRTLEPDPQNGHELFVRDVRDVRSRSPLPPVHMRGSFDGSLPENENDQSPDFRSNVANRSLPGQLES